MKILRVAYVLLLVVSFALSFTLYYKYKLNNNQLNQYQILSQYSDKAITELWAKLAQSKKELKSYLKEVKRLNESIASLESENTGFQAQLQALKKERSILQARITTLMQEKLTIEQRFLSLKELKKAIKLAKQEERRRSQAERQKRIVMLKRLDELALALGNRGYLIREGTSTYESKVRVKVDLEPIGKWSYRDTENK